MPDSQVLRPTHTDMPRNGDRLDLTEQLAEYLNELPTVDEATVHDVPTPRVKVTLVEGETDVPNDVREVIREYECDVRYPSMDTSGGSARLGFTIVVEEQFRPVGTRTVRENGPSAVVTLTPEALEVSGFQLGDRVDLVARDDQVCITPAPEE